MERTSLLKAASRAARSDGAGQRPTRGLVLLVGALVAWSVAEVGWRLRNGATPDSELIALLWAAAIPLPLLLVRRWPAAAALAVIALNIARSAAEYRIAGTAAMSVVILVALFAAESQRYGPSLPWRGVALGVFFAGATALVDVLDLGGYSRPSPANYAHLLLLAIGGIGAGVALRDRRAEVAQLEGELRAAGDRAVTRLAYVLAAERTRIAAEIDGAVAMLLDRVRPLAERAAAPGAPTDALVRDMRTVEEAAKAAMTEMRRALRLLRAPEPPPPRAGLAPPRPAWHERARRALVAAGPVALLAAVGLHEQLADPPPEVAAMLGSLPAPALGAASPYVTVVVGVLPLLWRARAPVAAALAVCALLVARMALHDLGDLTWTQFYVAAAAGFLGAAHARSRSGVLVVGAAAVAASVACLAMETTSYGPADYLFVALLPAAAAIAGLAVRDNVATAARARSARAEVDRLHEEEATERVAAQRLDAARDLHDVIGHAVTVVGMQAAVARRYVDIDLERARAAAAIVAEVAADAERDLTRLTEFLDTEPPADVEALVARWRAAGLPVTLENGLDELRAPLPIAQVAFRIVQEALTNVVRHAGDVPTSVTLAGDGVDLVIEVVNRLASGGAGTRRGGGIVGMRERAESYGGRLEAGPDGRGAWRVSARLPLGRPARPLSSPSAARS